MLPKPNDQPRTVSVHMTATENLCGNRAINLNIKEEIRIDPNAIGIRENEFVEVKTRLIIALVQKVSDYIAGTRTFRNEKLKLTSVTNVGDSVQLIRNVPAAGTVDANVPWVNKIVRTTATNATAFGASLFVGFQIVRGYKWKSRKLAMRKNRSGCTSNPDRMDGTAYLKGLG